MQSSKPSFYVFRWRRRLGWNSIKVLNHRYDSHQDKLVAFRYPNGGLFEIKNWSQCEARLGDDWVNTMQALQAEKRAMESESAAKAAMAARRVNLTPPGSPAAIAAAVANSAPNPAQPI